MMKLMKSMMINCHQATFLISKREEGKLSFSERVHLAMHLAMCKFCKLFEKQTAFIAKQAKNFTPTTELSAEDKTKIVRVLERK